MSRRSSIIARIILSIFILHQGVILLHHFAFPTGFSGVDQLVFHWVHPAFHQQFRVMGPTPPDRSLRLYFQDSKGQWHDPCYDLLVAHFEHRFSSNWRRYYRSQSLVRSLYGELWEFQSLDSSRTHVVIPKSEVNQDLLWRCVASLRQCNSEVGVIAGLCLVEIPSSQGNLKYTTQQLSRCKMWTIPLNDE